MKTKWIGRVLLALVAYHLSLISLSAQTVELKIIETSDIHGHFFPYDFVNGRALNGTSARANTYIK